MPGTARPIHVYTAVGVGGQLVGGDPLLGVPELEAGGPDVLPVSRGDQVIVVVSLKEHYIEYQY